MQSNYSLVSAGGAAHGRPDLTEGEGRGSWTAWNLTALADSDTVVSLGEKITDAFVKAFASSNSNVSMVFLPFALTPEESIVQKSATDATPVAPP